MQHSDYREPATAPQRRLETVAASFLGSRYRCGALVSPVNRYWVIRGVCTVTKRCRTWLTGFPWTTTAVYAVTDSMRKVSLDRQWRRPEDCRGMRVGSAFLMGVVPLLSPRRSSIAVLAIWRSSRRSPPGVSGVDSVRPTAARLGPDWQGLCRVGCFTGAGMKFSSLGGVEATARVVAVGRDCRWGPYAPRRRGVRIGCSRSHGECRLPIQCSTPCELPNLGAVIADPWLTLLPWLRVPERLSRGQVDGSFATDRVIHLREVSPS